MLFSLFIFLLAFVITYVMIPLIINIVKKYKLYDMPGRFKIQHQPIPKMGGIAFCLSFVGIVVYFIVYQGITFIPLTQTLGIIAAATLVAVISLIDDIKRVSPNIRLLFQIAAGFILVFTGTKIGLLPDFLSIPLTILWIVGIANAFNLIDGLDGLAGGVAFVASVFFVLYGLIYGNPQVALLAAIIAGSTLAFLRYNFHPAKIFMGDVGSVFLGTVLAAIGVLATAQDSNIWELFVPLLILAVPLLDMFLSVLRRAVERRPLFDGDREHLYDILMLHKGLSHRLTVISFWVMGIVFGGVGLLIVKPGVMLVHILFILLGMGIVIAIQNINFSSTSFLQQTSETKKIIPVSRPTLPDLRELKDELGDVFATGQITNASYVEELEKKAAEYLGVNYAVAVANCTSGLILVEKALGLTGEVIVPSFTFSATVHSLLWNNLKPVFVDCDPATFNIDPTMIENKITPQTAAILAVYVGGLPPDIEALEKIARKHNLKLIFDSAHAFGSKYRNISAGNFGDAEVFSLSPSKPIAAGEGGIVATNNSELARKIKIGRDYGNPGNYDCEFVGLSARMSELHAILALKGLADLENNLRKRLKLVELYKAELGKIPGVSFQRVEPGLRSTYKDLSILINPYKFGLNRDKLARCLEEENILTKKYYYPPVHQQSLYKAYAQDKLPTTEYVARNVLSLPLYSHMKRDDVLRVCETIEQIREDQSEGSMKIEVQLAGKSILVTGAGGSIGKELSLHLAKYCPKELILVERDENRTYHIRNAFQEEFPDMLVTSLIVDVKNEERMREIFTRFRPEIVFHAAAHKHVHLMEQHPYEAVTNNILGTKVLAELANEFGVENFVLVSTDKAVNPKNVMGATKRVAEMILQDMAQKSSTKFIIVRFGNVINSEGSVLPFFRQQIEKGGPVTITHPDMKRYFMSIPEAVELIIQAAAMGKGGEVFMLDMGPPIRILDLVKDMIRESGKDVEVKITGTRPGETLNEYLYLQNEDLLKTQHPKILVSNNGYHLNESKFEQDLQALTKMISTADEERIKKKLLEICLC